MDFEGFIPTRRRGGQERATEEDKEKQKEDAKGLKKVNLILINGHPDWISWFSPFSWRAQCESLNCLRFARLLLFYLSPHPMDLRNPESRFISFGRGPTSQPRKSRSRKRGISWWLGVHSVWLSPPPLSFVNRLVVSLSLHQRLPRETPM